MDKPKLIIMVGNIASGKSTWIKKFLTAEAAMAETGYVVISMDAIREMLGAGKYVWNEALEPVIETIARDMMLSFMLRNVNIIMDETNMDKASRKRWLSATKNCHNQLGHDYHTIAAIMPTTTLEKAVNRRMENEQSSRGFSKEVWTRVWTRKKLVYEEPLRSEGFNEIWRLQT